ncbi:MAG: hypothetical protein MZV49_18635 [Rhodopseudomonas palustris]|nr:hypothetical protein [Rhodopseudomonas palustris]
MAAGRRSRPAIRYNPDVKSLLAMVPAVDPAAAADDPGHAGGAGGGAREGTGLDHQPLRHARSRGWNSCSASSCPISPLAMRQLPAACWRWRVVLFRRAGQGQLRRR